ncbi:alkaline phosphatase family protein [Paenibacillus cymbidii]|uniref:alkaline phosphatase family protein n=1 Tax=Paenibacillus cymbidii TaxID=1639034 RepID=UPI001081911B|nr:alkaline phosphatase family protein [Paenibacillus cymbidii]
MKSASLFEIVAARCWNVLNEGKTFTPVFVLAVFAIALAGGLDFAAYCGAAALLLPLGVIFYVYDYPLHLRWFLLPPLAAFLLLWGVFPVGLFVWAVLLYLFFTVFFWGTLYYHLRIGTTWWNFTRIWKLFLINSDSTSGNPGEQLPKTLLLLAAFAWGYDGLTGATDEAWSGWGSFFGATGPWLGYCAFAAALFVYSWAAHRLLFTWKPVESQTPTPEQPPLAAPARRVVVLVIDGCRKERFEQADAPFLHRLMREGVYYDRMETVYPARTVVCFSSMFTGANPREHGIRSNMVWKLGVRVESIFDSLRKQGRKGILFGCAHLIDAFGDDVASFTAVEKNSVVDIKIIEEAKRIMKRERPDLMVVQLIAVDQTGHSRGVLYPEYAAQISQSDELIRGFCEWMEEEGLAEETTYIVMADHGQGNGIGGHGHLDVGERFVPFVMYGHGVRSGVRVGEPNSIVSVAPTIAHLLGAPVPSGSRGRVLTEALDTRQSGASAASWQPGAENNQ